MNMNKDPREFDHWISDSQWEGYDPPIDNFRDHELTDELIKHAAVVIESSPVIETMPSRVNAKHSEQSILATVSNPNAIGVYIEDVVRVRIGNSALEDGAASPRYRSEALESLTKRVERYLDNTRHETILLKDLEDQEPISLAVVRNNNENSGKLFEVMQKYAILFDSRLEEVAEAPGELRFSDRLDEILEDVAGIPEDDEYFLREFIGLVSRNVKEALKEWESAYGSMVQLVLMYKQSGSRAADPHIKARADTIDQIL